MKNKTSLIVFIFLCASYLGFGQILTFEFSALAGNEASANSNFNNSNLSPSTITRGAVLTAAVNGGRFNATNWALTSIANAVSGNNYMEFTVTPNSGYSFDVSSIVISLQRSGTGPRGIALRSSIDSYVTNLDTEYAIVDDTSTQTFTFTFSQTGNSSAVTYRIYMWAEATGGSGGPGDYTGNDIIVNGSVTSTEFVDWCNLQWPPSSSILDGTSYNVYAQVEEASYINGTGGPYPLITAWIGHSLVDSDPTIQANSGDWTWEPATFNVDISATRAEYVFDLASVLSSGTYYYCSRFQYNGGPFKYGGYNSGGGGFWQAGVNLNQELIITPDQVNFCNVQYPKSFGITTGSYFEVYAQAYEPGVTDSPGEGTPIDAWIGYNTIGINHQPWDPSGWTWIEATYNPSCLDCNSGANDEYYAEIGCGLPAGTYYFASRFQLNGSDFSYGGIQSDGVGNFWDATYNSGTLTITDPPLADVVITEIMYNTHTLGGSDDDWIEICNVSGSVQDISNYIVKVDGSSVFTFPCNTTIADGDCITIDLGNGGGSEYNIGCPFSPDYSSGLGTGTLPNSNDRTITLNTSNGSVADTVTYNNNDGGDGNGSSLHVIDATQDNSNTGTNWQEVDLGGSTGENSLIPNCIPMVAEINVEGNLGTYQDIPDGATITSPFDNTLFAAQYIGASQTKSYRIQNLGDVDLNISNITITGDIGDFNITGNPSSPIVYGTPSILEITFSPIATGTRTAIVHIFNNDDNTDGDTEEEYTFTIQGEGLCSTNSNTISPSSGPIGTVITVNGTYLSTATASFNGISATVNHISATEMEVIVPNGAVTGNIEIVDDQPCTSFIPFTIIDNQIGGCDGGSSLTEIFISEVTDATYGGLTYIELYNATGADVDLSNYSLKLFQNGNTDTADTNNYKTQTLSGIIGNNQTFVLVIGNDDYDCPVPGGDGSYADLELSIIGGINKPINGHDYLSLYNNLTATTVDEFGVFGDNNWMDSVHTPISGTRGFNFRRLNTATPLPNQTFNDEDWLIIDWAGSGFGSCDTNDYSDIGIYDFSTGTPPVVASGPTIASSCNSAIISVSGTEGNSGGKGLAYQWYYSAPGELGWTAITNGGFYDDATTATLDILDTSSLEGYQYYCQIREDDTSCYTASDAVQLTLPTTTWDGTSWSSPPTIDKIAIIDGDYDTATSGSFEACNLIVNSGNELNVRDYTYVKIQNNVIVDGSVIVQTHGAFVQVDDSGSFTLNPGGTSSVIKETALIKKWYEYTYWSSPVKNQKVEDAFPDTPINRRFWYKAQNYLDSTKEVGNNNQTVTGQDDIDDNGDDWQIASGASTMTKGLGYAATSSQFGMFPRYDQATFEGEFHTGEVNVDIYRNDSQLADNNWNLLGNPYPSAISADLFLSVNTVVDNSVDENVPGGVTDGAIFFWSQDSSPSKNNNGNENENFAQSDYAIINTFTQTKGGDNVTPNRYIPSGQGFFISYANGTPGTLQSGNIYKGTVKFTNNMRMADGTSNSQFFRTSETNSTKSTKPSNTLWINLISDNGVFNQIAIGYVQGATNSDDGMSYDTQRNLSNPLFSSIYTMIDGQDKKFAIQGKDPNSLNTSEIIPLGFDTTIDVSTLYTLSIPQVEGEFLTSNPIYLKDKFMNVVHNLSESDYTFTSQVGEFKDRFEIVFQSEALSDIELQQNTKKLSIIELEDGRVQFKTNNDLTIQSVQIIDMLGRTLYQLKGTSASEIYNLNTLSQSAYIAKVELSNGQVITKQAIKRK